MAQNGLLSAVAVLSVSMLAVPALADPVLTIMGDGEIGTVEMTYEDLTSFPQTTVVTANEFVDGMVAFSGPLVRDVLAELGLDDAEQLRLTAANDYAVEIPVSDFHAYDVIFALEQDGRRLSLRDKGPIWVIYPMSDHPELQDPIFNARLIWQVVKAEAL